MTFCSRMFTLCSRFCEQNSGTARRRVFTCSHPFRGEQ